MSERADSRNLDGYTNHIELPAVASPAVAGHGRAAWVNGASATQASFEFCSFPGSESQRNAPHVGARGPMEGLTKQQDAVEWLRSLSTGSVDLIVTDPAYESLEKHRARGTTTRLKHSKASSNDWFRVFPNSRFPELFDEAFRVLKRHSHFYLFCDQETMFVAKPLAEAAGFRFWKPLVWDKRRIGMGYHYRCRYEFILFFEKGKRRLADLSIPDILEHPRVHGGYPAQKPTEVSKVLIRQSSEPGELVIDPFTGSGSVGVAALELGRRFAGCDICDQAVEIANERLLEAAQSVTSARAGGAAKWPERGRRT